MGKQVISLFSGAGGLDLGLEAAGFKTKVCVEIDEDSCRTLELNRDWAVIDRDLHTVSGKNILLEAQVKKGAAALLVGGPPCQPFSKSGFWNNGTTLRMKDPRASTIGQYLRVLRETLPNAFLLENVPGFVYQDKEEGLKFFIRELAKINRETRSNYKASWAVIDASDFGVPQIRSRLIMIGSRDGKPFYFPTPTHSDTNLNLASKRTTWDAIGDLEHSFDPVECKLTGRWTFLLPTIPEGQNYLWHTSRGDGLPIFEWRSRYWNFLLKLSKSKPSWTIQASPGPATGPFHWNNRRLSEAELLRIQTFPRKYCLVGNQNSVRRQIGNAVPCALAELLGLEIRRQLFGERPRSSGLLLSPSVRLERYRAKRTRTLTPAEFRAIRKAAQLTVST